MITIDDQVGTLTADQSGALRDKANAYPFDLFLTITGTGSKSDLQANMATLVTKPNVVAIGLNPAHRFTVVRASRDLGLPDGPTVAAAGNVSFKQADIVGGVDAIASKANELRVASRVVESASGAPIVVQEHPMATGWWWGLGGLGVIVIGVGVWAWCSKRRRERELARVMAEYNNATGDALMAKAERGELTDFDRKLSVTPLRRVEPVYVAPAAPVGNVTIIESDYVYFPSTTWDRARDVADEIVLPEPVSTWSEPAPAASSSSSWSDSYPSSSSSSWSDSSSSGSSWSDSSSSSSWSDSSSSSGSDW